MGLSHSPSIVTDGLVLCLDAANPRSYPGSGTSWLDLSGEGYNSSIYNATFSNDNLGIFNFDGTDDYMIVSTNATSELRNLVCPMTIITWTKLTVLNNSNVIFSQYAQSYETMVKHFRVRSVGGAPRLELNFQGWARQHFGTSISLNQWYFLAAKVSGTNASPSISFYVNNIVYTPDTSTVSIPTPNTAVGVSIGSNSYGNEEWNGSIATLRVYNRALSTQEILHQYDVTKSRFGL